MVALTPAASVIEAARTIVIKIGSSILVDETHHAVNADWLTGMSAGVKVILSPMATMPWSSGTSSKSPIKLL